MGQVGLSPKITLCVWTVQVGEKVTVLGATGMDEDDSVEEAGTVSSDSETNDAWSLPSDEAPSTASAAHLVSLSKDEVANCEELTGLVLLKLCLEGLLLSQRLSWTLVSEVAASSSDSAASSSSVMVYR